MGMSFHPVCVLECVCFVGGDAAVIQHHWFYNGI